MRFTTIVVVGVLTLIAGFVPAVLFFRTTRLNVVLAFGAVGLVLSWALIGVTSLPPVVDLRFNAVHVYPFWSGMMSFLAGAVAQAVVAFRLPTQRDEERLRRIQEELEGQQPQ